MYQVTVVLIAVTLLMLYYLSTRKYNYWKIRGIPYERPLPLFGNYLQYICLRRPAFLVAQRLCERFPNAPLVGTFYGTQPALLLQDPDLVRLVTTKDFYYFNSREVADYTPREAVTQNLFFTYGDRWKVIRNNLTPLFTSAKMKNMFYLIEKCTHQLEALIEAETSGSGGAELDMRQLMARFTMDCIGSCAFGVETNTLIKSDEPNPYRVMGDKIFENSFDRGFRLVCRAMWPAAFYGLRFRVFPEEIIHFFKTMLLKVFEVRGYRPTNRNDFVDLLLDLKQNNYLVGESITTYKNGEGRQVRLEFDDETMSAQCVVFFAAGYETSATTLAYTLHMLARHPAAQDRVIAEVEEFLRRHGGRIPYDCVYELPYTMACVQETLRLFPVLGVVTRELVEDHVLPGGLHLSRGLRVHIPVYHFHHNSKYFPNPEEFDPERFLGERKKTIKPYTYMPFGEGPRLCIGMRFAWMQMLAGLAAVFRRHSVATAHDSRDVKHFHYDPTSIVTIPTHSINLKLVRRDDQASPGPHPNAPR
ncbi:cytochrome P450 6B5-like [Papilio machaon]|uniref:cytochrome P450 6B5-like n=1 Tax=Papilio machaon TaxID=76193 RepID=UPI001E6649E2|nr:cytochrome P450 6B5-like [Papilio machaon]